MRSIVKFLRLAPRERRLLVQAALLLAMIRIGLHLFSFATLRFLLAKLKAAPKWSGHAERHTPAQIVCAVRRSTKLIPGVATCLNQALTLQLLLERQGYPARLRIGVARSVENDFQAHAWVETDGQIAVGERQEVSYYTPLPSLDLVER